MRNKLKRIFIVAVSGLSLIGCSTVAKPYEANPIMAQQSDLLEDGKDVVNVKKLEGKVKAATDKEKRNALMNELITISDRVCSLHQAKIIANANAWNVATGTTTSLLSALGTVLGGTVTKTALAAAATFSNSTRSLVNEEVYIETIGTTIVRAISVAREKYYAEIESGMTKEPEKYTVAKGLRDVQEYHRRCSFYYGLVEISKSLEQRKKTKNEIGNEIQTLKTHLENNKDKTDMKDISKKINSLILEQVEAPN
ncbi:MAG: hypothetical protein AUJ60_08535 [Nitrospirae bacterium CG1_02_44_142]|nr:MAG: hypothetical protein AUJ60_08535 [Nitrospirae bacterium CG1_02_44_142]